MSILETQAQQRVACQKVLRALWKQRQINLLNCGQRQVYKFKKPSLILAEYLQEQNTHWDNSGK